MEESLLPTKMGSVAAGELGRALGEAIKNGSGPETKLSPCSMTRSSLKESLQAIKESVKQGLGLSPGVVMMEVDVTEMNPFSKEKWGIDGDSTTIWVPQSSSYREGGESFFGPPLRDIFGEKNVKVSTYSSKDALPGRPLLGAFGISGGAPEGGPPASSSEPPPAPTYQWLHTSRGIERVPVRPTGKSPGHSGPGTPGRGGNLGETGRPVSEPSPSVSQVLKSVFGIGPTSGPQQSNLHVSPPDPWLNPGKDPWSGSAAEDPGPVKLPVFSGPEAWNMYNQQYSQQHPSSYDPAPMFSSQSPHSNQYQGTGWGSLPAPTGKSGPWVPG